MLDKWHARDVWAEAKEAEKPMGSIYGQTLGIIGCGAIGRMVARKARWFWDERNRLRSLYITKIPIKEMVYTDEIGLTLKADYVSCIRIWMKPVFTWSTKGLLITWSQRYLINTSRGQSVDEAELIKGVGGKKYRRSGLDVFENEPLSKDILNRMDNVICLPHTASYSDYSFSLCRSSNGQGSEQIFSGKLPLNAVNKSVQTEGSVSERRLPFLSLQNQIIN